MNARKIQRENVQPTPRWDRETALVAQFTACVSIIAFAFYLSTEACSSTATPSPTSTSRAGYLTPAHPACCNSAPYGCPCHIC